MLGGILFISHARQKLLTQAQYHAYTVYLFIASDIKTMIIPNFLFAFLAARIHHSDSIPDVLDKSSRILTWLIFHLLAFTVSNQSSPAAILEDKLNKPWRPIPSGRLDPDVARKLIPLVSIASLAISASLPGGINESILLQLLFLAYNDLQLGDTHWLSRNVLNAAGFATFAAGATSAGQGAAISYEMRWKMALIVSVVTTTVHSQDLYDQEGDRAAGRKTFPLCFGDVVARWTISMGVVGWSVLLSYLWLWRSPVLIVVMGVCGTIVAMRTLRYRNPRQDRGTFWFYNGWLMSIYVQLALRDSLN